MAVEERRKFEERRSNKWGATRATFAAVQRMVSPGEDGPGERQISKAEKLASIEKELADRVVWKQQQREEAARMAAQEAPVDQTRITEEIEDMRVSDPYLVETVVVEEWENPRSSESLRVEHADGRRWFVEAAGFTVDNSRGGR